MEMALVREPVRSLGAQSEFALGGLMALMLDARKVQRLGSPWDWPSESVMATLMGTLTATVRAKRTAMMWETTLATALGTASAPQWATVSVGMLAAGSASMSGPGLACQTVM